MWDILKFFPIVYLKFKLNSTSSFQIVVLEKTLESSLDCREIKPVNPKGTQPWIVVLQEGGPLPGPETGLLSNTWKWIVRGDTCADKARDFIGKGHPGGEQEGKGTQENCSATWLPVLGFMVMGLVSRWLWPIILIQSLS